MSSSTLLTKYPAVGRRRCTMWEWVSILIQMVDGFIGTDFKEKHIKSNLIFPRFWKSACFVFKSEILLDCEKLEGGFN